MPEEARVWTIGELLRWTKDYLEQQGSDSPRIDAEVLLAHARGCKRIELYAAYDEVASEPVRNAFRGLVKQRAEGMPVAYLVENKEFYSRDFYVNPSVLIPRPETEFLLIRLLDLAKQQERTNFRIADIGTGSGVLAICAACVLKDCHVVAIDASQEALDVARRNAEAHGVADRIEFRQGDLLSEVAPNEMFDFVVSNPPYVSDSEFEDLDRQVKDYEPKLALVGGPTGTEIIQRLVPQAAACLSDGGWLLLEISPMIKDQVLQVLTENDDFTATESSCDLAKLPRIVESKRQNRRA